MIRQVCFYLSRACNLRCAYCKVPLRRRKVLDVEKQKEILYIIKNNIKAELVVLFGGEPLLYPFIVEIVNYCHWIDLPYALISNSTPETERNFQKLVEIGLRNYTASVDSLKEIAKDDILKKSSYGVQRLLKAKELGVPDVVANIIISKRNIEEVPEIVKFFSSKDIWSIVGVVHCGDEPFWEYRSSCSPEIRLTEEDKPRIEKVAEKLLEMKREGYKIHNVKEYFELMPKYYLKGWHCKKLGYLMIEEDGTLMDCPDFRGESGKYTIFDFVKGEGEFDFERLEKIWKESVKNCPGCFYNHEIQVHYGGKILHSI